jgi:uncharacterized protein with HEPN domain
VPLRSWEHRIADITEAIEAVLEYTAAMSFEQFVSDRKTIDAVIRNFIIIGEAASHFPEDFIAMHPDLPWREMRDMRNIVVHEYFAGFCFSCDRSLNHLRCDNKLIILSGPLLPHRP